MWEFLQIEGIVFKSCDGFSVRVLSGSELTYESNISENLSVCWLAAQTSFVFGGRQKYFPSVVARHAAVHRSPLIQIGHSTSRRAGRQQAKIAGRHAQSSRGRVADSGTAALHSSVHQQPVHAAAAAAAVHVRRVKAEHETARIDVDRQAHGADELRAICGSVLAGDVELETVVAYSDDDRLRGWCWIERNLARECAVAQSSQHQRRRKLEVVRLSAVVHIAAGRLLESDATTRSVSWLGALSPNFTNDFDVDAAAVQSLAAAVAISTLASRWGRQPRRQGIDTASQAAPKAVTDAVHLLFKLHQPPAPVALPSLRAGPGGRRRQRTLAAGRGRCCGAGPAGRRRRW